jgi:hypothetical protein
LLLQPYPAFNENQLKASCRSSNFLAIYATDSWSSVTGLATVAYGTPDRHPEVANQVIAGSPVAAIVNQMTPGALVEQFITADVVKQALDEEYLKGGEFARYVDRPGNSVGEISKNLHRRVMTGYGEMSSYEASLADVINYAAVPGLSGVAVAAKLNTLVPDLNVRTGLAASVPSRKPDKLPAGARIPLLDSVNLATDHRGVNFSTGYLTPEEYFTGTAFPGAGRTAQNLPDTIIQSLQEGYTGYATLQPLESLLRPGLASLISLNDIQDVKNVSRSVAGLGTIGTIRDFTGIGSLSADDRAMYDVDLSDLIVRLNGYTTYQPEINSNGDFKTPVPMTPNSDPGQGLPYSQRTRQTTFS